MNEKTFRVLELEKILHSIAERAKSKAAKEQIVHLKPSTYVAVIENNLTKAEEAYEIFTTVGDISRTAFSAVDDFIVKAQKGSVLSIAELHAVKTFLRTCLNIMKDYEKIALYQLNIPHIRAIFSYISIDREFAFRLDKAVLSSEEIDDNASKELADIRRQLGRLQGEISNSVYAILNHPAYRAYLSDNVPAMKNRRLTIPLRAEYRGKIKGVVQDISASGATIFIEPEKTVQLNSKLVEAQTKEAIETERILAEFSAELSMMAESLLIAYDAMVELDALFAKASYAALMQCTRPALNEEQTRLYEARHPLIDADSVVPSDIFLGGTYQIILITGPNTGGKTVAIKTLGLLSIMAQCGLMIPVKQGSQLKVFEKIYADIGDEQNIEQSLSTFSSHMANLIYILDSADKNTLVLIDEIGAGTDPQEGSALGMALMDCLLQKGAYCLITTHYSELKKYAMEQPGVINASMEFDSLTLKPLFKLSIGLPGESNALKIARRLGLDEKVVQRAEAYLDNKEKDFDEAVRLIRKQSREAEDKLRQADELQLAAKQRLEEAEAQIRRATAKGKEILRASQEEAGMLLSSVAEQAKQTTEELRRIKHEADAAAVARAKSVAEKAEEEADRLRQAVTNEMSKPARVLKTEEAGELVKGDRVYIAALQAEGDVRSILDEDHIEVAVGAMRLRFAKNQVQKIEKREQKSTVLIKRETRHVSSEIDVRGMDSIEALSLIDKYIDDAFVAGYQTVRIIHGKGEGILRRETLQYLKTHPHVKSFRQGAYNEGGSGVTVAVLK